MSDISTKFAASALWVHSTRIIWTFEGAMIFFPAYKTRAIFQMLSHTRRFFRTIVDSMARSVAVAVAVAEAMDMAMAMGALPVSTLQEGTFQETAETT